MFAHLSARSFYSFGIGTASVEALCRRAHELGFPTIALTDVNGLYAIGWFLRACRESNLIPIVGAEVRHETGRAILLPYSPRGYSNLCHFISARHLETQFTLADAVLQWRDDLVIISDSFAALERIAARSSTRNLYVELRSGRNRSEAMRFSRTAGIPAIVTGDVHFLHRDDHELHVKLRAIHLKKTVKIVPAGELADQEAWLKSASQMEAEFASYPEALDTTARVVEQCAGFCPRFADLIFPLYQSPAGRSSGEVLRELVMRAAQQKYFGSPRVLERLEQELEIIIRKGFADTFLVMRDIVKKSAYTCGRGSAAASLVSFLLEITSVDPMSCDLYFGRFLNEARSDPPDIDMDFAQDERRRIIDSIFSDYGEERVAMVANHCHMGMRQAIRRLAELEGIPQAEIARITRYFSGWGGSIETFCKQHPIFKGAKPSDKWPAILRDAERLVGIPTHVSLHPGGMVIAPGHVDDHIPRQRSRNGIVAIQTEKDQTEDDLRMVKIDILGNTSLCVLRDALTAIREQGGEEIDYRDWRRFASDAKTCDLIVRAQTMGCFHIESASFLQLLEKTGPGLKTAGPQKIFDTLVILSSIIRPASNKSIHEFLRRFHGGAYEYEHPKLEEILGDTFGLPVYQEHVNLLAMGLAGFSEIEADQLRKALTGKKSENRIRELLAKYVAGCRQNHIPEAVIQDTAAHILQFVNYSFLKAHSASYIILALACVYLKAHYPAIFMAARMSYMGGFWGFRAYVSECQRLGLRVLMPDINESKVVCIGAGNCIRIGLMRIKGVQAETKKRIVAEREVGGRFTSFTDFLQRVPVDDDEMTNLILAGVFDALAPDVQQSVLQYLYRYWVGVGKPTSFEEWYPAQRDRARALCLTYSEAQIMRHEAQVFGTLISRHPLERYAAAIKRINRIKARDLKKYVGKAVHLVGWPIASKEVTTVKAEPMEFWAFEDESAVFHAVLFPKAYAKFCRLLLSVQPIVISGVVQEEYGAVTVNVMNVNTL